MSLGLAVQGVASSFWGLRLQHVQLIRIIYSPTQPFIWGFPKLRGTFLRGPHSKDYRILGSILGPPILGNHLVYIDIENQ